MEAVPQGDSPRPLGSDLYFNTSLLLEEWGEFGWAKNFLEMYLEAAPAAPDADKIRTKIIEYEYKEKAKAGTAVR